MQKLLKLPPIAMKRSPKPVTMVPIWPVTTLPKRGKMYLTVSSGTKIQVTPQRQRARPVNICDNYRLFISQGRRGPIAAMGTCWNMPMKKRRTACPQCIEIKYKLSAMEEIFKYKMKSFLRGIGDLKPQFTSKPPKVPKLQHAETVAITDQLPTAQFDESNMPTTPNNTNVKRCTSSHFYASTPSQPSSTSKLDYKIKGMNRANYGSPSSPLQQPESPSPMERFGTSTFKKSFNTMMKKIKDFTSDKPKPKVSGNFNYQFRLEVQGTSVFQAGYLIAKAYVKSKDLQELAIPTRCRWYRLIRERKYEVPGVVANIYQLSADDIGATIMVRVEPLQDDEFSGCANASYGPIQLTQTAKKRLEDILAAGSCKFSVNVRRINKSNKGLKESENNALSQELKKANSFETQSSGSTWTKYGMSPEYQGEEGSIIVQTSQIRLSYFDVREKEMVTQKTGIAIDNPRIKLNLHDMSRFKLMFPDTKRISKQWGQSLVDGDIKAFHTVDIKALSPQMRDLIILTMRCFMLHSHLKQTQEINEINSLFSERDAISTQLREHGVTIRKDGYGEELYNKHFKNKGCLATLLLQAEASEREVYKLVEENCKLEAEKQKMEKNLADMEEQIQFTVRSYNAILAEKTVPKFEKTQKLLTSTASFEDDMSVNNSTRLREDEQYEITAIRKECDRLQEVKTRQEHELLQKDTMMASLRDQLKAAKQRQQDELQLVQENNTLRLKMRELTDAKNTSETELQKKTVLLEEKERFISDKMKSIEQHYLHKELDMLGKIDNYKAEIKSMKHDCEELHRLKSEQASFFQNEESKIYKSEKGEDSSQQELLEAQNKIRELEEKNEQLLIQRNQLQKMKESIIKDTERKKEEIAAVRGESEAQIEKLKAELQSYKEQDDEVEVLRLEKKELEKKVQELGDALQLQITNDQAVMSSAADSAESAARIQILETENESLKNEVNKLAAKLSRADAAARRAQR